MSVIILPIVLLKVDRHIARASGSDPVEWSIYAEYEDENRARAQVMVEDDPVADITVHPNSNQYLEDEVQSVCAAILWSALRSWALRNGREVELPTAEEPTR